MHKKGILRLTVYYDYYLTCIQYKGVERFSLILCLFPSGFSFSGTLNYCWRILYYCYHDFHNLMQSPGEIYSDRHPSLAQRISLVQKILILRSNLFKWTSCTDSSSGHEQFSKIGFCCLY